jgi:predicted deacylase
MVERQVGCIRVDNRRRGGAPDVVSLRGAHEGRVAVVVGNVHGDECTGIAAIHELDRWLQARLQRGEVHLYPSVNAPGLATRSRGVGVYGGDLNRLFPGDARGGAAERLANAIWADVLERRPDVVIDLHADSAIAVPYVILDRPVSLSGLARIHMIRRLRELGAATSAHVLWDYPDAQYRDLGLDRSLAGALVNRAGIPALTLEIGPRRAIALEAVATMVAAMQRLLRHLGLVESAPPGAPPGTEQWRRSTPFTALSSGIFVPRIAAGERFGAGATLGEIRSVLGDVLETFVAASPGFVISWTDTAWVTAGSSVGTFAVPDEAGA